MHDLPRLRRANDLAALRELHRNYLCAGGADDPAVFCYWLTLHGHRDLAVLHRQLRAE